MGVCMTCTKDVHDNLERDIPTFCSYECADIYDPAEHDPILDKALGGARHDASREKAPAHLSVSHTEPVA